MHVPILYSQDFLQVCFFLFPQDHRIAYLTKDNSKTVCLPDFGSLRHRVMGSFRRGIYKTQQAAGR